MVEGEEEIEAIQQMSMWQPLTQVREQPEGTVLGVGASAALGTVLQHKKGESGKGKSSK
jgi:hypothetical protein